MLFQSSASPVNVRSGPPEPEGEPADRSDNPTCAATTPSTSRGAARGTRAAASFSSGLLTGTSTGRSQAERVYVNAGRRGGRARIPCRIALSYVLAAFHARRERVGREAGYWTLALAGSTDAERHHTVSVELLSNERWLSRGGCASESEPHPTSRTLSSLSRSAIALGLPRTFTICRSRRRIRPWLMGRQIGLPTGGLRKGAARRWLPAPRPDFEVRAPSLRAGKAAAFAILCSATASPGPTVDIPRLVLSERSPGSPRSLVWQSVPTCLRRTVAESSSLAVSNSRFATGRYRCRPARNRRCNRLFVCRQTRPASHCAPRRSREYLTA